MGHITDSSIIIAPSQSKSHQQKAEYFAWSNDGNWSAMQQPEAQSTSSLGEQTGHSPVLQSEQKYARYKETVQVHYTKALKLCLQHHQ